MSKHIITNVRRDRDGVITHFNVNTEFTKEQLIKRMQSGENFVVPSGEEVHLVGGKYIRSDRNNTTADNLGNLPSF
jgi:hypothetical protein